MTALDAVDSSKAVPSSRTPTRPPTRPSTLSQYLVETLLHMMISNHSLEYIVHGWCERAEDEGEEAARPVVVLLLRLAVTTYHYRHLRSHPSSRVQLKILCRLPTLGTAASHHQTLQDASAPGQLDLDKSNCLMSERLPHGFVRETKSKGFWLGWLADSANALNPTRHHLDRRLLVPTLPGNKLELAQHPHLLLDVSKPLWTLSFYAYVSR